MIEVWNKILLRDNLALNNKRAVCELHFLPEDIIKCKIYEDKNGKKIIYPLLKPRLQPQAIPSIFPNLSSDVKKTNLKKQILPVRRQYNILRKNKTTSNTVRLLHFKIILNYVQFITKQFILLNRL